jgi:hypothetical protein
MHSRFGSPQYILGRTGFEGEKRAICRRFSALSSPNEFFFAVKSNNCPEVAERVLACGYGLDVSSGVELEQALRLKAREIVFSGPPEALMKAEHSLTGQYLSGKIVDAGKYTQIRLEVNSVRIVVGKNEYYAKVPSGDIKLVGNFEVLANNTTKITLDFDGEQSVNVTGKNQYMFKPVIKLLVEKPSPSAVFTFRNRSIKISLKKEYLDKVEADINEGLAKFGLLDDGYWKLIRRML